MELGWAVLGWVVAAIELGAVITLFVLWRVSTRRRTSLQRQLAEVAAPSPTRRARQLMRPEHAVKAVWETAALVRDKGFSGALRSSIADIANWAEVDRPELIELAGDDGCVAIMFSDIESSTELNEQLGDRAWMRLLSKHDEVVVAQVERHGGRVIKHQGDGYMSAFPDAASAAGCAVAVQRALRRGRHHVSVRMGMHYGSVVHRDNDIFGRNVALAARVASLADGGEVLVSGAVADELADHDLGELLADPETVELKGISGDQLVARLAWR